MVIDWTLLTNVRRLSLGSPSPKKQERGPGGEVNSLLKWIRLEFSGRAGLVGCAYRSICRNNGYGCWARCGRWGRLQGHDGHFRLRIGDHNVLAGNTRLGDRGFEHDGRFSCR